MTRRIFISDLHLSEDRPELLASLVDFVHTKTEGLDELYLLGDIFEAWVGDDDTSEWLTQVGEILISLHNRGIALFFIPGNRDFLMGEAWCKRHHVNYLGETHVLEINNERWLLTHGDELCTDDTEYQAFRALSRSQAWREDMLSKPLAERLMIAQHLRQQSKMASANKPDNIMDVNSESVEAAIANHNVVGIIHGHTHRPATHTHGEAKRIVLGDWRPEFYYAEADHNGVELKAFDAKS